MLTTSQLPHNPYMVGWRSRKRGGKVHLALGGSSTSLCGLETPQRAMRPLETDWVCMRCEDSLRRMGVLAQGPR